MRGCHPVDAQQEFAPSPAAGLCCRDRRHACCRLGIGLHRVFKIKDDAIACKRTRLGNRAVAIGGQIEDRTARAGMVIHIAG